MNERPGTASHPQETNVVSVVIVSHNSRGQLEGCLRSLPRVCGNREVEVIVVDNGSTDGSASYTEQYFPFVILIKNTENLGYAKGSNQGIACSRGGFILLLNPDTVFSKKGFEILLHEMESNRGIGAVGPALLNSRGRHQISFGKRVDFSYQFFQKNVLNLYFRLKLKSDRRKRSVGWLSGASLLCRRQALAAAGSFDEQFFLYFEDIDLCFRMRAVGWLLVYIPRARVFHQEAASTSVYGLQSRYQYRKSQLYFYKKHNSRLSFHLLRFYLALNFGCHLAKETLLKGKNRQIRKSFFGLLKES